MASDSAEYVLEATRDSGSLRILRGGSLVGSFLNDLRETLELYPLSAFERPVEFDSPGTLSAFNVGEFSPPTYPESKDLGRWDP